MRIYKPIIVSIILLSAMLLACLPIQAQEEGAEESAEINAFIKGNIPSIKLVEWTSINITIVDAFGIDWDYLREIIPEWYMRMFWPLNPAFPQPVERFLGYTSLRLEPEIVEGDPDGWFLRVNPSAIPSTSTNYIHKITLEAKTDDSAVDYAVVVGIKCTRIDTLGGEVGSSYIYVPVKASPSNFVEMRASVTTKHAPPKSIVYFTVDITNNGYYKDVFQFELKSKNGLMGLFDEQAVVLSPGETRSVNLGVLTPETFYNPGTPSQIDVYVYSGGDPSLTLVGSLVVVVDGLYVSPLVGIILVPIIIVLIIIYLMFFYVIDKRDRELFGKPDKPWTLPEEKKYLDKLKEKDKEEYDKVRQMMKDEYQSALLWFKSYRNAMKHEISSEKNQNRSLSDPSNESSKEGKTEVEKPKDKEKIIKSEPQENTTETKTKDVTQETQKTNKTENIFTKLFKNQGKKKLEKPEEKEQKPADVQKDGEIKSEETKKEERRVVPMVDKKAEMEKQKREKTLLKIKREQEKQRKKIKR